MPIGLEGNFYKTIVRLSLLYVAEKWAKKKHEEAHVRSFEMSDVCGSMNTESFDNR